jgi:hypothetical protein
MSKCSKQLGYVDVERCTSESGRVKTRATRSQLVKIREKKGKKHESGCAVSGPAVCVGLEAADRIAKPWYDRFNPFFFSVSFALFVWT